MGPTAWFVVGFGIIFFAVLTFALLHKLAEVRPMRKWAATAGTVLKAEARSRRKSKRHPALSTFAEIEYAYQVGGRKLRGRRVSVAEETPNVGVQARLRKYPPGTVVTVYYNPAGPQQSVLEREFAAKFWLGMAGAYLFFATLFGLALYAVADLPRIVRRFLGDGFATPIVMVAGGGGAFCVLLAIALHREVAAARGWRSTPGRILKSHIVRSTEQDIEGTRETTYYRARTIYEYGVDGQTYRSDRVAFGGLIRSGMPSFARRGIAKYPAGSQATVYYNPNEPSEAVLEPRAKGVWILWLSAALLIGVAVALGR